MKTEDALNMELMRIGAEKATGVLRVLANEDRLLLLCAISQDEMSVGELEEALDIHRCRSSWAYCAPKGWSIPGATASGSFIRLRMSVC